MPSPSGVAPAGSWIGALGADCMGHALGRCEPEPRSLAASGRRPIDQCMHCAPFLSTVEQVGGLSREQAERAIEATLRTLAERITGGEAEDIAAFLPKEVRTYLFPTREEAERFGLDEFYRRVAE